MEQLPRIFDQRALKNYRQRHIRDVSKVSEILTHCADILLDRLDDVKRDFTHALEIGGRGVVAPLLQARGMNVVSLHENEGVGFDPHAGQIVGGAEQLPFAAESFDLVVASLSLHTIDDLLGTFLQIRALLKPDGLFLASLPIAPTLTALRHALMSAEEELTGKISPRVIPMPSLRDCAALLQKAGFALPVIDKEEVKINYSNPFSLLRDLQYAGESNPLRERSKLIPPRSLFPLAMAKLQERYGDEEGGLPLVLHMGCLIGWSPAEGQPKPLQPGEYKTSLHDIVDALPDNKQ